MNKRIKNLGLFVLGISLFLLILPIIVSEGPLNVIINSPSEGAVYQLSDDILLSASIIAITNIGEVHAWVIMEMPDGSFENITLWSSLNSDTFQANFHPSMTGVHKATFYAEDNLGNTDSEMVSFIVEGISPSGELDLVVISPINGSEFDLNDEVELKASVSSTSTIDVQKYVKVEIIFPDGSVESIVLTTLDETVYVGTFSNTHLEGIYKATFYAEDNLGNIDTELVYFEIIKEEISGGNSGGNGGSSGGVSTKYYVCVLWSDWSECLNGFQERFCLKEDVFNYFKENSTKYSQLGDSEKRLCQNTIDLGNDSQNESENKGFFSYLTGFSIQGFGNLINLVWFLLVIFILILILIIYILRKRFS
ncbi:MAG: hypothetical protein WC812_00805 [Candidatus Pacearchaeota archaeon]|jgi:hypothetical protein